MYTTGNANRRKKKTANANVSLEWTNCSSCNILLCENQLTLHLFFADVGWDFSEGHEWAGDLWRFVPNNDNKNSNLKNLFLIGLINFVYWLQPSFRTWCSWSRRTLTSPPSLDRSAPTSCPLLKWKRDLSPGVVLRKWMTTMSGNTEAALTDS